MTADDGAYIRALAGQYNYRRFEDRRQVFVDIVLDELSRSASKRVLDVGCGQGISAAKDAAEYVAKIRKHAGELWGLDPALTAPPSHGFMDQFRHGTAETAQLPENYFDVAYSFMVLEHVDDPAGFFRAISRTLKPGGAFVLATVNAKHYFTRFAKMALTLRIDEAALRIVKKREAVDKYHFPTRYRCNSEAQVRKAAGAAGFGNVDFAYSEERGPQRYFPGPLRIVPYLGERNRRRGSDPTKLLTMYIVARKAG